MQQDISNICKAISKLCKAVVELCKSIAELNKTVSDLQAKVESLNNQQTYTSACLARLDFPIDQESLQDYQNYSSGNHYDF
jgi:uncharacterized protein YoxC